MPDPSSPPYVPTTIPAPSDDGPHMRRCSRCGRHFKSRRGADQHIQTVHKGRGVRMSARMEDRPGYEPSMGELVVQMEQDRAAGVPVPDWAKGFFP